MNFKVLIIGVSKIDPKFPCLKSLDLDKTKNGLIFVTRVKLGVLKASQL